MEIKENVKLGFDPKTTKADRIDEVFADDVARTLWLTWRPSHIVNQYFGDDVLTIAKRIKKTPPTTVQQLRQCFYGTGSGNATNFVSGDVERYCPLALPYFTGEKTVAYEVVPNDKSSATRPK